jgi:hypothetical protein
VYVESEETAEICHCESEFAEPEMDIKGGEFVLFAS